MIPKRINLEKRENLICSDNLPVLKIIPDNSIDLCYIDPPFYSKKDWEDFNDKWCSLNAYLEFMKIRLNEIHRILKLNGSFYLHCDWHSDSYLRTICDEIFGYNNLRSIIYWVRIQSKNFKGLKSFPNNTDTIYHYSKSDNYTFNIIKKPLSEKHIKDKYKHDDRDGKGLYYKASLERNGGYHYEIGMGERPPTRGYAVKKDVLLKMYKNGKVGIERGKLPYKKIYLSESDGSPIGNVWDDINFIRKFSDESLSYETQKPEKLLERIIMASSNKNDIVADFFCGSGTALAVAKKNRRKYLGIDINEIAINICSERLSKINIFKELDDFLK